MASRMPSAETDGDEHRPTVDGQIAPDDLWIHARP